MSVRVSVVVPTYRRPELLDRCLAALAAQDLPAADYEVIVADNAGSDDTRRQAEAWAARAPAAFRWVDGSHARGPAAARNAGWRAARGDVIAFTDDDCVPDPGWLSAVLAGMGEGRAAGWGAIHMPLPERPTDYERNESGLERAEFATANCFCRRDVLAEVGGFDERFATAWREDADLFLTLLEKGYKVERVPAARVVHPVRPARWGVSLAQQRKSAFNALLYKKHPRLYRQRIQPAPPWHYYGAVLGLAAAAAGLALGQAGVALAGAAVWLGLTARFCLRRLRGTSRAPRHVAEMVVTSALIPPLAVYWRLRGAARFRVFFL